MRSVSILVHLFSFFNPLSGHFTTSQKFFSAVAGETRFFFSLAAAGGKRKEKTISRPAAGGPE
jgi:hypothetical protein